MWHHWDYGKHLTCYLDIFIKQVSFDIENIWGNQTLVSHMEKITWQHKDMNFIFDRLWWNKYYVYEQAQCASKMLF